MKAMPAEVREFMATLKGDPVKPTPEKRPHESRRPRCADCRKPGELVRYGLATVCRRCAAERDRAHGLAVSEREWA